MANVLRAAYPASVKGLRKMTDKFFGRKQPSHDIPSCSLRVHHKLVEEVLDVAPAEQEAFIRSQLNATQGACCCHAGSPLRQDRFKAIGWSRIQNEPVPVQVFWHSKESWKRAFPSITRTDCNQPIGIGHSPKQQVSLSTRSMNTNWRHRHTWHSQAVLQRSAASLFSSLIKVRHRVECRGRSKGHTTGYNWFCHDKSLQGAGALKSSEVGPQTVVKVKLGRGAKGAKVATTKVMPRSRHLCEGSMKRIKLVTSALRLYSSSGHRTCIHLQTQKIRLGNFLPNS